MRPNGGDDEPPLIKQLQNNRHSQKASEAA